MKTISYLPRRSRMLLFAFPWYCAASVLCAKSAAQLVPLPAAAVLRADDYRHYIDQFNAQDNELYADQESIRNADAWPFLQQNIPLFDCPDSAMEEIYYFRWWTYRKHIEKTPDGYVITEFLPKVPWAGKYNTIDCAAGHHIYEGRWLRNPVYTGDYINYWLRKGSRLRQYSFWIASSVWERACVTGNFAEAENWLDPLIANYNGWSRERQGSNGLYWQFDGADGMEMSIGGRGYRATINSYQYGDARAIAALAGMAGRQQVAQDFQNKAARLKKLVQESLWDPKDQFFKVSPIALKADPNAVANPLPLISTRELHGYTPWYFDLPDADKSIAWKQLMDPRGFYAPFGPTTTEQRDPRFAISYKGHECQWNGPSWPFATSITLTAMANLLDNYQQNAVSAADYFNLLQIYTKSQHLRQDNGRIVPWIDEDLNPRTGEWLARAILKQMPASRKPIYERGKDYNHSTYCDLIISGLVGLRPRADNIVEVRPLVPPGTWDYFCLDGVPYHGHTLTILYDKTGTRYRKGAGFAVLSDGRPIATSRSLGPLTGKL
ncbi:MAG TPA: glycosyl hydrolase family 65 protein [Chthoniobacteraceae bacterium]|nr:glycosyl hydrolase family 65 protein [Chthoniobacteraceae bacterium]